MLRAYTSNRRNLLKSDTHLYNNMEDAGMPYVTHVLVFAVIVITYMYLTWHHGFWQRRGIPGARPYPLVGTMYTVLKKGILFTDRESVEKYGKVVGEYVGRSPALLVTDRAIVRQILIKDFNSFTNRADLAQNVSSSEYPLSKMLTVIKDNEWKRVRNTLTPAFSATKFKAMVPQINQCAKMFVENLAKDQGRNINVKTYTDAYTFDVIARVGFGIELNTQEDPDNPFIKNAREMFEFRFSWRTLYFVIALFLPRLYGLLRRLFPDHVSVLRPKSKLFFVNLVRKIMTQRQAENTQTQDLIGLMINAHKLVREDDPEMITPDGNITIKEHARNGLSEEEVLAQSILLLLAGFETTSTSLSFLLYSLALNPDCQKRAQQEIDRIVGDKAFISYELAHDLTYLDMCICESLRLYPPAVRTDRQCSRDVTIEGLCIPRGINVSIGIAAIHYDPALWINPKQFNPQRFSLEAKADLDPFAYIPFGAGPRNCIGMRLAQLELRIAMARVLQKFTVSTCDQTEIPIKMDNAGMLKAKNGIHLKLEHRDVKPPMSR